MTPDPTDAHDPRLLYAPDSTPDWSAWTRTGRAREVTTIHLGTPGKDQPLSIDLPPDLATRFPNLTHLRIWNLGLRELPPPPAGLLCLEARKCVNLKYLPPLPETLECLDMKKCTGLQDLSSGTCLPRLKELLLDGCSAMGGHGWNSLQAAVKNAPLELVDASGCTWIANLELLPASSLRKLVLENCIGLTDASALVLMDELDHLNLSGCIALQELPALPASLRFVVLHGCTALRRFDNQDISSYDKGKEGENVVNNLRSRMKFGKELVVSAYSKLLFMGDGRVGKSLLSKRLIWETLGEKEREKRPYLKPTDGEDPTHKMRFWKWNLDLTLNVSELQQRAKDQGIAIESTVDGRLPGVVRVWDFGGQEIYHNTHRIFAGEGSVFILVWRPEQPDWAKIDRDCPEDVSPGQWREWNRRRSLDYWLDYIDSMSTVGHEIKVALVRTAVTESSHRAQWQDFTEKHKERELPCFEVDSLTESCATQPGYKALVRWIQKTCGAEAERIGPVQPLFFSLVAQNVDTMLEQNAEARNQERRAQHLLFGWSQWCTLVKDGHERDKQKRLDRSPRVLESTKSIILSQVFQAA